MNIPLTLALKKVEIQEWLERNNTNYEDKMTKTELLQLVQIQRPPQNMSQIPSCHETIRLPPYHCDLNAIEFIWKIFKTKVAFKNVGQCAADIENITMQVTENINMKDRKSVLLHM
jgi:hypothetical protein